MNKRKEPVGNTCPEINELQRLLNDAAKSLEGIANTLDSVADGLETLRSANAKLREWGSDAWDLVDELEARIKELEEKLEQ